MFFFGVTGYYWRFIPNFSKVARPLHSSDQAGCSFCLDDPCQQAFVKLKELLSSPPVLAYLCFSKPFVLHTDASGQGLGAVLEQEQADGRLHPIAYVSRTLSAAESCYGITDLQALGVVWAAKHLRDKYYKVYLLLELL